MPSISIKSLTIVFFLLTAFLLVWWFRYSTYTENLSSDGTATTLVGTISNDPKLVGSTYQFSIENWKIYGKTESEIEYGDLVSVTGLPGAGNTIKQAEVSVLPPPTTNQFQKAIGGLKAKLSPIPYQFVSQRAAELVNGMVLGVKPSDKYFMSDLRRTGTIHIIVVSGENLSIVAGFLMGFKNRFGKRRMLWISFCVIWLYALVTGAAPPVMRAAIMITFAYVAQAFGRQYWDLYALGLAAAIMLFIKPFLLYDVSFQLSFMATLGVIVLTKPMRNGIASATWRPISLLNHLPFGLADNLSATLAAQIMVDPLILYNFHQFSILSPLVNMLVLPVVLFLTLTGTALFLGAFSAVLGTAIGYLIALPATYFTTMTTFFSRLPVASTYISGFSLWMVFAYYIYIFLTIFVVQAYRSSQKQESVPNLLTITSLPTQTSRSPEEAQ